jgi:hypothetical protein
MLMLLYPLWLRDVAYKTCILIHITIAESQQFGSVDEPSAPGTTRYVHHRSKKSESRWCQNYEENWLIDINGTV